MKLTLQMLDNIDACDAGKRFFERNNLVGINLDKLHMVSGDYNSYLEWLNSVICETKFDEQGRVIEQDDVCTDYDKQSRPIKLTTFNKSGKIKTLETIAYDGNTKYSEYENKESNIKTRSIVTTNDDGKLVDSISYEMKNGNIIESTRCDCTYNDDGNLVKSVNKYRSGGSETTSVQEYEYDGKNKIKETQNGYVCRSYEYTNGYLTKLIFGHELGNFTEYVRDEQNRIILTRNQSGRILSESSYDGDIETQRQYGIDGKLRRENVYKHEGDSKRMIHKRPLVGSSYDFDELGRMIKQTNPDGSVYRNEYDDLGNKIMADNVKISYKYKDGRLFMIVDELKTVLLKIPSECFV